MEEMILQDICKIYDCPHTTAKDEGVGIPLVRTPNVGKGRLVLTNVHRVNSDVYKKRTLRAIPEEDDIIIAREAPVGNAAIIQKKQKVCLGQRVVLLKPNKALVDPNFLVYYLLSNEVQHHLKIHANGAVVAHLNVADIRNLSVCLPSLCEQKKIGKSLKIIDDKIELNRRINENLEQQAQALFKSWFVDFEPFKDGEFVNSEFGMIPKGWRTGVLSDIIEILSGFAFKSNTFEFEGKYKLVTIKAVQDGYLELNGADGINDVPVKVPRHCFLKKKDILLSLTGNVGRCCLVNSDNLLLNQRVAKIEPKKIADWAYTYILFRLSDTKTYLETISRGTAQANLSPIETANMPILIPTREVMDAFSVCATPLVNYSMVLTIEAEKLAQQRDTLLPKLMSGELKINDLTR
ncbi:restriction endonuclease subunit S [Bacteroides finegoldii]|uniref:restriction endonuclease subunit S n=1 Tax=Bacteroides finegoldii TaxID=338188 RepID=UPI0024330516|nr:restriction endonuclease subunit S [Bacteroides finegoldii]